MAQEHAILPQGSVDFVASEWGEMLASADLVAKPHDLYCGRAWREGAHMLHEIWQLNLW